MEPHQAPINGRHPIETFPGDTWDPRRRDYSDPIRPHPMFPLDDDQPQETRRIYFISIMRKSEENGVQERCPKRFTAEELREQGWNAIVSRYGRGWYRAEGMSSCFVKQSFTDWQYFAGPDPRPFYEEPNGSVPNTPPKQAAQSSPPSSSVGMGNEWLVLLQMERERTERDRERMERALEAERERNQRLLEMMLMKQNTPPAQPQGFSLKELLEVAKGSQPQLTFKDMLEFAKAIPQQGGGLRELRENLEVLEALGIGRNNTPNTDQEGAMAKDLITTVQSVISSVKTSENSAPSTPPVQAPSPPAQGAWNSNMSTGGKMARVMVEGLGEVLVPEERLQGIMIAQRGQGQTQANAQAQSVPQAQVKDKIEKPPENSGNSTPPSSAPPSSSPSSIASAATQAMEERLATLTAQVTELESALTRISAFLTSVFVPAPAHEGKVEANTVEVAPVAVSETPQGEAPPGSKKPMAETAKMADASAKVSEVQGENGGNKAAGQDVIITPPPAMPSPDQIDQMLSMPEMLEMLPPDLRQQTEQIRSYYRSQVREP